MQLRISQKHLLVPSEEVRHTFSGCGHVAVFLVQSRSSVCFRLQLSVLQKHGSSYLLGSESQTHTLDTGTHTLTKLSKNVDAEQYLCNHFRAAFVFTNTLLYK